MGLLGTSAQAFTDNFLKTYMSIGEDRRSEEAQKIAKQMAEAKLAEYAREQAMQAEAQQLISGYQQPTMGSVPNQNAFNMTQNQPVVNGLMSSVQGLNQPRPMSPAMPQQNPMGFLGLSNNNPTIPQQFPSKIEALRAQGVDPGQDIMSSLQNVIGKYDPVKGATLMANTEGNSNKLMNAIMLAQLRDKTANRGIDVKEALGNQANDIKLSIAELKAKMAESGYGKEERDIVKPMFAKMPEMQKTAREAIPKIKQYEMLTGMLDRGAGGIEGGLKAVLAPVAEYLGDESKSMSEAQAYKLIARAGAGAMRLNLIGPGQVSNYEQDLIQQLSGGDIKVSRAAARDLFKYYMAQSKQNIKNYNESVDSLVGSGYKKVGDVYKKIDYKPESQEKTVVERRTTSTGKKLVKYSDGSIGEE